MQRNLQRLNLLDKLFPFLVLLCIPLGLMMGKLAPQLGYFLEPFIPFGLFMMIYPTVVKVTFEELRRASLQWKPITLTLFLKLFN